MPSYLGGERCNDCSGTTVSSNAGRCMSCGTTLVDKTEITQKRMWNQVRAPSSVYTMNLAALNVAGSAANQPGKPNWNQSSDRHVPSVQKTYVPSRGNSTRSSQTSSRPGGASPGGSGVDVKHNSYDRYLARKKAGNLRTQSTDATPRYGNKMRMYSMSVHGKVDVCPA